MSNDKRQKRYPVVLVTSLLGLIFALGAGFYIHRQMEAYESGLLDVCATQQDGYVQLVLDQINLKDNRDDAEIITDILGTLDASSNKYWTFSSDRDMLFVKDVLETNKYKGFTADSYYGSESAAAFLKGLQTDRVTHGELQLDGKAYIASGVAFQYNGRPYRLCLLTNRSVLLDNNVFLGAKVDLLTTVALTLLLLVLVPLLFARRLRTLRQTVDEQEESVIELNRRMELLNKRLSQQDLHDTRRNLWTREAIPGFLEKLAARDATPTVAAELRCADGAARDQALKTASRTLNKTVLRFAWGDHDLLLLFVQTGEEDAMLAMMPLLGPGTELGRRAVAERPEDFSRLRGEFGIEVQGNGSTAYAGV